MRENFVVLLDQLRRWPEPPETISSIVKPRKASSDISRSGTDSETGAFG